MGSLERRLRRLEAERKREETALSREALTHLSDEDLYALEGVLEAGQEDGSATFEDLYRVSSETSRRALDAYFECIEALSTRNDDSKEPQDERAQGRLCGDPRAHRPHIPA